MIITIIIWNIQFIVPLSFIGREVVTSIPGVPDRSLGRKHGGKNQNHVLHTRVRNFEVPLGILVNLQASRGECVLVCIYLFWAK